VFDYNVKVGRVVDGDTVDVIIDLGFSIHHKARVRMMGIDTPESRTRNLEEKALGLASKARLKELLKGQKVRLECTKEKGKFGRILGSLWIGDVNINDLLVAEGHARLWRRLARWVWEFWRRYGC
jgi:endonuclease YncB( thermonuclease family)